MPRSAHRISACAQTASVHFAKMHLNGVRLKTSFCAHTRTRFSLAVPNRTLAFAGRGCRLRKVVRGYPPATTFAAASRARTPMALRARFARCLPTSSSTNGPLASSRSEPAPEAWPRPVPPLPAPWVLAGSLRSPTSERLSPARWLPQPAHLRPPTMLRKLAQF